jgi:hypothetical protein
MAQCTNKFIDILSTETKLKEWLAEQSSLIMNCDANSITIVNTNMQKINDCMNATTGTTLASSLASKIGGLQQSVIEIENNIDDSKESLLISEERVKRMAHREKNVSFYESWFPMDKPLKMDSVPILIGFSILFFTIFVGIVATAFGINLELSKEPINSKSADLSKTKLSDFFNLFNKPGKYGR